MLNYNEIVPRAYILLDGEPYEVLASHVFRKQQRKPVNQTKLRHLITGKVTERSFHQAETVAEADLSTRTITYIYSAKGECWFFEGADRSKRFSLPDGLLGQQKAFLKENSTVEALVFNEKIIGVKLPIKLDLKVTDAPPAVKGNTAQGASKEVRVETGALVRAPLFINEGDIIRVNTETGDYVERVEKK